ncbi:MAG TPA: tetratricopeptide repeat protein [Aggregatilineales bacterium]|nr:tetratricopeptide repeat protein [Aggregatilineales bacterium]
MATGPADDSGDIFPSLENGLERRVQYRLQHWLERLSTTTSKADLEDLQREADTILKFLQTPHDLDRSAAQLAADVDEQTEYFALDKPWYVHLAALRDAAMDPADVRARLKVLCRLLYYFLDHGYPTQAQKAVDLLLDASRETADAPVIDAALGQILLSEMPSDNYGQSDLGEMLVSLAEATGNLRLLGRVYAALAYYHAKIAYPSQTFEYAQMACCVAQAVMDDALMAMGLHHMASAFQVDRNGRQMRRYTDRAVAFCIGKDLPQRVKYLQYMLGVCCMYERDYAEAERWFRHCTVIFRNDRNQPFAQSLYMRGLALMELERWQEAAKYMQEALEVLGDLNLGIDQDIVNYGIAELQYRQGQRHEAKIRVQSILHRLSESSDGYRRKLEETLYLSLKKYSLEPSEFPTRSARVVSTRKSG